MRLAPSALLMRYGRLLIDNLLSGWVMDAIDYATLHLSDNDHAVLRSLINLLQADRRPWQEVPVKDAQVVFLDVDSAPPGTWESAPAEMLVCCSRDPGEQAAYTLQLPVKLKTLRPVFTRLDAELPDLMAGREPGSSGESGDSGDSGDIFTNVRGV